MHKGLRIALGFIVCSIVYVAGFIIGGLAVALLSRLLFFLPEAEDMMPIIGSAVGSNFPAIMLFNRITGKENELPNIAFSIYLICIAAIFLFFFFFVHSTVFITFACVSFILNGFCIKEAFKEQRYHTKE